MTHNIISLILGMATIVTGCTSIPEGLQPITGFEPDRYLGKWYEIARLDHSFERDLSNVSAIYTRGKNHDIRVKNRGFNTKTGAWKQIEGHARFLEEDNFIEAEFTSVFFRFVDDVEFYYDDRHKVIHVKSASRVGYSDLGVNRRRVEKIRKLFDRKE